MVFSAVHPAWPFFVAAGVLWAAYKIAVAAALLAVRHRKSITVALAVSGSVTLTWTTIHMRGLAEREDGFPLEASTSTRVSQVIPGQHGRQAVDVYTSDQFGSGFYRSLCSLVGASHHYYFSAPAIDNHAKLEHERITGWKLFKVNGGSVRDSQIVVRDGAIVIAGSVTHSILKAERIIVKGNVSRDSTLIVVKPEPPFFPMPARAARHHKA